MNASRWIAALLVMIGHIRHLILADLRNVEYPSLIDKGFYFFTGLAPEAVIVFFVVSGLLVGGLTLEKFRTGTSLGIRDYFIHRFSRIYIVLIPVVLIGVGIDHMGANYFDGAELYSNSQKFCTVSMSGVIKENIDLLTVLGNLAMLENISVKVLGSNGPLWSLAYEWWFYCIWVFALGAIFCRGIKRYVFVALFALLFVFLPLKIYLSMSVWLLGVFAFYYGRSGLPKLNPVLGGLLFLVAMTLSRLSHNVNNLFSPESAYVQFGRDFGFGLAYSIALASCFQLKSTMGLDGLNDKLASFSYSLYLTHFPLLVLIVALVEQYLGIKFLQQPSATSYTYFLVVSVVIYLYSYLFSLITEKHTYKLIKFLRTFNRGRLE